MAMARPLLPSCRCSAGGAGEPPRPTARRHQLLRPAAATPDSAASPSQEESPLALETLRALPTTLARRAAALPPPAVNTAIAGAFLGGLATRAATVDADVWRGWTAWEILREMPADNWAGYLHALETQPLTTAMLLTGATYWLADWVAQTYEGNALLDFNAARLLRSAVTGLVLLGPLAHAYYHALDAAAEALLPGAPWYAELAKIALDNTAYCFVYNFCYIASQGALQGSSAREVLRDWRGAWWRLQTAGWRVWPFAGLVTHFLLPTEHKVLFVDAVELGWVTYLSLAANAKRAGNAEAASEVELASYLAAARESSWEAELVPDATKLPPADSMPHDHLLLANQVEEAVGVQLGRPAGAQQGVSQGLQGLVAENIADVQAAQAEEAAEKAAAEEEDC